MYNDLLYFLAYRNDYSGEMLFSSDGTAEGTKDIAPSAIGFPEDALTVSSSAVIIYKGLLYFPGSFADPLGSELYATNGIDSWLVADVTPGPNHTFPNQFFEYNDNLCFASGYWSQFVEYAYREVLPTGKLHCYNGTAVVELASNLYHPSTPIAFNNDMYFFASNFDVFEEDYNNDAYLQDDQRSERELYRLSADGLEKVSNAPRLVGPRAPARYYFSRFSGTNATIVYGGRFHYLSDSGEMISTADGINFTPDFLFYNSTIYRNTNADDRSRRAAAVEEYENFFIISMLEYNGEVFFRVKGGDIYTTDFTQSGTQKIVDVDWANGFIHPLYVLQNQLYYSSVTEENRSEGLHRWNGTNDVRVATLAIGRVNSNFFTTAYIEYKNRIFLGGDVEQGRSHEFLEFRFASPDIVAPSITCPPALEIDDCTLDIEFFLEEAEATDNCGEPVTISTSIEFNTVTYTATDSAGNSASCSISLIFVDDLEDPLIQCPDELTAVATSDDCSVNAEDLLNLAPIQASDDCAVMISAQFFNGTATFTAIDGVGKSTSCFVEVTVVDQTIPIIECPSKQYLESITPLPQPTFFFGQLWICHYFFSNQRNSQLDHIHSSR